MSKQKKERERKKEKSQLKSRSTKKKKSEASPRYKYCLAGEDVEWHGALEVMSCLKNMTGY